jgi:hypothetical protein
MFDKMPANEVSLFVWLPTSMKLFQAFRGPRVFIDGDDVEILEGYEVELFPIRYSQQTMLWFLNRLGLIRVKK